MSIDLRGKADSVSRPLSGGLAKGGFADCMPENLSAPARRSLKKGLFPVISRRYSRPYRKAMPPANST
ncbi:hypothetical protein, partial [Pseudomonas chlororaphis]|uniref:hypothetical protein n=1 Tax=Pseudomonas chlororaphis TaxID=587753 RepID=UPI001C1EA3D2